MRPHWIATTLLALLIITGRIDAYSLYLKPVAVVERGGALIGDIARVDGDPDGVISGKRVIEGISGPVHINRRDLIERLAGSPLPPDGVYGSGTWILPLTETLSGEALLHFIRSEFQRLPGTPDEYESAVVKMAQGALLRTCRECELKLQLPNRFASLFAGRRIIAADILEPGTGKILYRQKVDLAVLRKSSVPVAKRNLIEGERLNSEDFAYESREIDPDQVTFATGRLAGRRVLFAIKEGGVMTQSAVQAVPPVRRGQMIDAVFQSEAVVIICRALAGQDGEIGDRIAVKMLLPTGAKSDTRTVRIVSDGIAVFESGFESSSSDR
jgi:flagella basal body P-ring formation protein FlgA